MINVSILKNGVRYPVIPMIPNSGNGVAVYNATSKDFSTNDRIVAVKSADINKSGAAIYDPVAKEFSINNRVVPVESDDVNKSGVVVYNPVTKEFSIGDEVITVEDLIISGDVEVKGSSMFRDDVSIAGDLFVDGTEHINDSETVQTTGDYFILRHNSGTPLATGENAGLAVFNYALNKTATLTVDKDGTWRIADNTASSTVYNNLYYFDGHYYDTSFIEQTFTDQIKTAFDVDEVANCVLYNNAFYHFDNTNWFAVSLVNNHLVTDATEITDAPTIAILETLTKKDLQYFRRLQITTIVEVENQPLLTRDEATNLDDAALLKWDAANTRAVGIDLPTLNGQVLTYNSGQTAFDKHLITVNGIQYEEYPTIPFTETVPAGCTTTSDVLDFTTTGDYYYSETENAIYIDDNGTYVKLLSAYYNSSDEEWVDGEISVAVLPADATLITAPSATHYNRAAENAHYEWKEGGGLGVAFIGTRADYEVAKLIPLGTVGHIPSGSLVVITDEQNYTMGDNK